MIASGNDFVVIDGRLPFTVYRLPKLAREMCERKYGIGADGLLVLEKSKKADIRMRIFNADGSEAEMCGNGARCTALWAKSKISAKGGSASGGKNQKSKTISIETKAGIIEAQVKKDNVRIKLTNPTDMKLNIPLEVNRHPLKVNYINTGVPHAVVFVEGLDALDVKTIGEALRHHAYFKPRGTNVNFVEVVDDNFIRVRSYERGVEAETLACGTGSVASALITSYTLKSLANVQAMAVLTQSKEILKVYFNRNNDDFSDVWLEGKARIVFTGQWV
jgi:diaminopimelate epimerase